MHFSYRLLVLSLGMATTATAQSPDSVVVRTIPLRGSISMLMGQGGNIGVSTGEDGSFVIDDDYAPVTAKVQAALTALSPKPVRFVVNTHWHGDHTGGNESFGAAGAIIVAHDNVRRRMSTEQFIETFKMQIPPAAAGALPVVTFTDQLSFHWNGEEIRVFHVKNAHTDGDAVVHFTGSNVIHTGDIFFNGFYPFIDASNGGSLDGTIAGTDQLLALANEETRIIPGHGPPATRSMLVTYRRMLVMVRDRITALVRQKKTLDQVIAAKPTADLDGAWGKGFMTPDVFVTVVYTSISKGAR